MTEAMQKIKEILKTEKLPLGKSQYSYYAYFAEKENEKQGDLHLKDGINCLDCNNKGYKAVASEQRVDYCICDCMKKRESINRIKKSGLENLLKECTFDSFEVDSDWRKDLKNTCIDFVNNHDSNWLFIGGQVGSGKTHLCTAVVGEFLKLNYSARYMLWRDEVVTLKANVNNDDEYRKIIEPLKNIKVLYIDDLFKTEQGKKPTTGDINVAFELLNYRYNNPELITILSSEKSIADVIDIDEAVGSRIYQKTKKFFFNIAYDRNRNYRLSGVVLNG